MVSVAVFVIFWISLLLIGSLFYCTGFDASLLGELYFETSFDSFGDSTLTGSGSGWYSNLF